LNKNKKVLILEEERNVEVEVVTGKQKVVK
jgi:hypothetical protein